MENRNLKTATSNMSNDLNIKASLLEDLMGNLNAKQETAIQEKN